MADENNQSQANQSSGTGGTPPTRPEWVPDKFWNTQKNEVDIQGMASAYTELSTRFAKGKEALVPEIRSEVERELFGKRPPSPDGYKFELPKSGPLAEKLAKSNLVLLGEKPGQDFKPEQGKVYYVLNKDGDTFKLGREVAYRSGMSNDEFMDLAYRFAEIEAKKEAAKQQEFAAALAENRKRLGEHADKRIDYVKGKLKAMFGDEAIQHMDIDYATAGRIETLEKMIEKMGEPRFSPEGAASQAKIDKDALQKEMDDLIVSPDYYSDKRKQARVAEISRQLSPGKSSLRAGTVGAGTMRK